MTPFDAEDASTPARCNAPFRVCDGSTFITCQLDAGHADTHMTRTPWDDGSVIIWPAYTSTTCGDV